MFSSNQGAIGGVVVDTGNFDWRQSHHPDILSASKNVHRFAFIERLRRHAIVNAGINTSPMNAYFTMLGIETLSLRYQAICKNAQVIADFFVAEGIEVDYPGLVSHANHDRAVELFPPNLFGPLLTIDLGSKDAAFNFISKLSIVQNMSNLGDNRTMVIHPKSTIYSKHTIEQLEQAGVTDGLIRISIGIEDSVDLIAEFKDALS